MSVLPLLVVLATLAVLFVPGTVIGRAAGLGLGTSLAAGPLVTYGLATATGTLSSAVHVPWRPWLLVVETLALAGPTWLLRRRHREAARATSRGGLRARYLRREPLVVVLGVVAGGVGSALVTVAGMGGLSRPNQDWDYTFHANATRFIADSGDVAPSALRVINDWDAPSFFYPNAYHALAALVRDLTGAPVFTVLNSQTILLGLLAGLGLAALLRALRAPTAVTALAPALLAGFAAFPYDLVWRGPVLPYATGLALVPACLVLLRAVLERRSPATVLLAALAGAGLLGLQPSNALTVAVLVLAMLVQRWAARRRIVGTDLGLLAVVGVLIAVLSLPEVVGSVRTGVAGAEQDWPAVASPGRAVLRLLLVDQGSKKQEVVLALLVVTGLLTARRLPQLAWWLAGTAVAATLFVLAAGSDSALAQTLTLPWWNDAWRLAGWTALGVAPVAAHGFHQLALGAAALVRRLPRARRWAAGPRIAVPLLLLAVVVASSGGLYGPRNVHSIATAYRSQRYLDTDEVEAMAWLAARVQPGETVMNDPGDGSAYMLALDGIRPLFGHQVTLGAYATMGPRQRALLDHFNCLDTDPRIRQLVTDLDVRYVFLSSGFVRPDMSRLRGLRGVGTSPSLQLVHRQGAVRIYRVQLEPADGQRLPACSVTGDQAGS